MPIISHLKALGWSATLPVVEATVTCPGVKETVDPEDPETIISERCGASKTYQLTRDQLKNIVDDFTVHRDAEGKIEWVEGTTRLLTCPKCGFQTVIKLAAHRSGTIMCCNPDVEIREGWWLHPE